jgi:hypothetical protein
MKMRWHLGTFVVVAAIGLAGCSKPPAGSTQVAQEIRGEPINPAPAETAQATAAPAPAPAPAAAPAASVAPKPQEKETPAAGEEFIEVGFDFLAGFEYEMPNETNVNTNAPAKPAKEQIPDRIKALDRKRVALKGFMLPLKVEGGLITEMLVMRDQSMCCYGTVPKINEWVSVKMVNKGVKPVMDQAVTLYGALKVGEMYENGYLVGIYQMDGEKMAGPLDL